MSETAEAATQHFLETDDSLDMVQFVTNDSRGHNGVTFQDMDDDGDLDIVVTSHSEGQSYWLENTLGTSADGLFKHTMFKHVTPTAIAFGDIDGNGTEDVVVGHTSGGKIFYNNGAWSPENLAVMLNSPRSIIVEDIDGDGRPDILIRDTQDLLLIKNVQNALGTQVMSWPGLGDSTLLDVGNFNVTNTTLEILTMDMSTGTLAMISHDGSRWQAAQTISNVSATTLVVQDLNGDGIDDIFVADENGKQVWLEGDGTGILVQHSVADNPPPMSTVSLEPAAGGDFDTTQHISDSFLSSFFGFGDTSSSLQLSSGTQYSMHTPPTKAPLSDQSACMAHHNVGRNQAFATLDDNTDTTLDYSESDKAVSINLMQTTSPVKLTNASSRSGERSLAEEEQDALNIIGSDYNDLLAGNAENNIIAGGKGHDIIFGDQGDDTLLGQKGHDSLFGGDGDDDMFGGKGHDLLFGDDGDDHICGGKGDDIIFGDQGNDVIHGGTGSDIIFGNDGQDSISGGAGNDLLFGGKGDDIIYGGTHADTLYGDSGNDTFLYLSTDDGGDHIADFTIGEDRFQLNFGEDTFYMVENDYSGDLGIKGGGFVWELTNDTSAKLFYDPDFNLAGDEIRLAQVDLTEDSETIDNLTFDDLIIT